MTLIRRKGFVAGLEEGVLWYASQLEHGPAAAELLAERFARAVDLTIAAIARRPDSGVIWQHRPGYRLALVKKPFAPWLIFYRQPGPMTVELVDSVRGERDLPRRVS